MAEIALTQGYVAIVDSDDFDRASAYRWCVTRTRSGRLYGFRSVHLSGDWRKGNRRQASVLLHRFIASAPRGVLVDHRNGDGLDCRRENLRICDYFGNSQNRRKLHPTSSLYKGIRPRGKRFQAWIHASKVAESIYLGTFDTEIEAALAYDTAAKQYFGEFACLNFPDDVAPSVHVQKLQAGMGNGDRSSRQETA